MLNHDGRDVGPLVPSHLHNPMSAVREDQDIAELPDLYKIVVLEGQDYSALLSTPVDVLQPHSVAGRTEADPAWRNHDLPCNGGVHGQGVVEQSHQVFGLRWRHLGIQIAEYLDRCDSLDGDGLEAIGEAPETLLE